MRLGSVTLTSRSAFVAPTSSLARSAASRASSADTEWVGALFAKDRLSPEERRALLVGRAGAVTVDDGPIVCACHHVGRSKICRAIAKDSLADVRAIGVALGAGTGCGSCIPELRSLLAETTKVEVAA